MTKTFSIYFFLFNKNMEIRFISCVISACFRIEGNHIAIFTNLFSFSLRSSILILDKPVWKHDLLHVCSAFFIRSVTVNSPDRSWQQTCFLRQGRGISNDWGKLTLAFANTKIELTFNRIQVTVKIEWWWYSVTLHSLSSMTFLRQSPSYARVKVPINWTLPEELGEESFTALLPLQGSKVNAMEGERFEGGG